MTSKSYKELLRRMHVIQDGKVIDGAESFLIIWKNVPKYNFLYKIFKIKPLFLLLKKTNQKFNNFCLRSV